MANQFSSSLKSLTTKAIAAGMKTLPHLLVLAGALFLFVGTAHAQAGPCPPGQSPCVLVSDLSGYPRQVKVYPDAGCLSPTCTMPINPSLLGSCSGGGGGGGEGISCISGSTNVLYVANGESQVTAYSMNLVGPPRGRQCVSTR